MNPLEALYTLGDAFQKAATVGESQPKIQGFPPGNLYARDQEVRAWFESRNETISKVDEALKCLTRSGFDVPDRWITTYPGITPVVTEDLCGNAAYYLAVEDPEAVAEIAKEIYVAAFKLEHGPAADHPPAEDELGGSPENRQHRGLPEDHMGIRRPFEEKLEAIQDDLKRDLTALGYQLVNALKDGKSHDIESLKTSVWGDPEKSDEAVRKMKSNANKSLLGAGHPYQIVEKGAEYRLEKLAPDKQ